MLGGSLGGRLAPERAEDVHTLQLVAAAGARMVLGRGTIEGVAALAAVKLHVLAGLLQRRFVRRVPALEVSDAELAFLALLVAGPLTRLFFFDLDFGFAHSLSPPPT